MAGIQMSCSLCKVTKKIKRVITQTPLIIQIGGTWARCNKRIPLPKNVYSDIKNWIVKVNIG